MADQGIPPATQTGLAVPPEVAAKFSDIIELIKASESMNAEERQYWVNILPIMTPEQLQNLRDILQNERQQLASIDSKYAGQINAAGQAELVKLTDEERRKRRTERQSKESVHRQEEEQAAEALLGEIDEVETKKKAA